MSLCPFCGPTAFTAERVGSKQRVVKCLKQKTMTCKIYVRLFIFLCVFCVPIGKSEHIQSTIVMLHISMQRTMKNPLHPDFSFIFFFIFSFELPIFIGIPQLMCHGNSIKANHCHFNGFTVWTRENAIFFYDYRWQNHFSIWIWELFVGENNLIETLGKKKKFLNGEKNKKNPGKKWLFIINNPIEWNDVNNFPSCCACGRIQNWFFF